MKQYETFLRFVLENGVRKLDRTSVGTISIFGYQIKFNLKEGFPLITTKKVHFKSIVHELLWFLKGETNIQYLKDNGVTIWDDWADVTGELGPIYGYQWRHWKGSENISIDQISDIISQIQTNPNSRRLIVSAWNVGEIPKMSLPPCHLLFQFYIADERLSCHMYQRSADLFLGVPFNIASYALLTMMIAQVCSLDVGDLIVSYGDAHIYLNHINQVKEQLSRVPRQFPSVILDPTIKNIFDFKFEDIKLEGYNPYPAIAASVAV